MKIEIEKKKVSVYRPHYPLIVVYHDSYYLVSKNEYDSMVAFTLLVKNKEMFQDVGEFCLIDEAALLSGITNGTYVVLDFEMKIIE